MRVSDVALDDFRSYRHVVVHLPPGPTVLMGPNGQGKTNFVEAIAYLSSFSSHRVGAEAALVRVETNPAEQPGGAVIRVKLVSGEHRDDTAGAGAEPADQGRRRERVVELEIVRGRANRARLNRTTVRPREILGLVRTVVFAPEDIEVVRGDPSGRRRFLDDLAVQLAPGVAQVRTDLDRVVRQRAAVLRDASARVRRGRSPDMAALEVWDRQFAHLSARLTAARAHVVDLIREPATRAYAGVAESPRTLAVDLDASVDRVVEAPPTGLDRDTDGEQRVLSAIAEVRDREIERGVNLVGAHRDELSLRLGSMPVKGYASHGETWSAALALRLSAFAVLEEGGEEPILILDDVFAELDAGRRDALARMVAGADQVLVTAAVADDVPESLRGHRLDVRWDAEEGSVVTDV